MNLFMDVFLNICTLLSGYLALWKLLDKREMPNRFLWNCAKWGYVLLAAFLQALVSQLHIPWLNLVTIAISFVGMTKLFFRCNLVPLLLYDTAVMVCLFAAGPLFAVHHFVFYALQHLSPVFQAPGTVRDLLV